MKNYISQFKTDTPFEQRCHESSVIRRKYPNRIPIIIESQSKDLPQLENSKLLVPDNITIAQFMVIVRKKIKLNNKQAIFLFINNTLPANSAVLKDLYELHKEEDNYLYCSIKLENTFG